MKQQAVHSETLNCSKLPQVSEGAALSHVTDVTAATVYDKRSNLANSKSCSGFKNL